MVEQANQRSSDAREARPDVRGPSPPKLTTAVRDRLVRLAYRFLWNRDDAEDVVQDALSVAHERGNELRESGKWWSWMCAVVVQRCRAYGRRLQRWKHHEETYRTEVSRSTGETAASDEVETRESVRGLLMELPRRQYEVMVLRHLQGMPYEEIGRVLGISSATARVHARAGREALRDRLLAGNPDWFGRPDAKCGGRP